MKDSSYISKKTGFKDFKKIFKNELPSKPIVWLGDITDLTYFIKLLHLQYKVIEKLPHDIWKITDNLFVDNFGHQFGWRRFRHQKPPAHKTKLKKAVEILETLH